jgi:uncharacterized iron-regulated protein
MMIRSLLPAALGLLVLALGVYGDEGDRRKQLEAQVRQLEKDIAAVRGLEFKKPVDARIIARPADTPKHIQGYYSTKEKALFVYDDIAGNYERGVLVHEMVHALQDQHFGLDRLHQSDFGTDADLAKTALVEGDATFTMIELLKKDQPRVAAMLETPLEKAKDIQRAFLYAQGARYVKALKERGGWKAVNDRYKFPPSSTASILHPEGVSTIDLGPGAVRGELAILRLFAGHADTRPLAIAASSGWKGDRTVEIDGAKAWIVAFKAPENGLRFQGALVKLTAAQHPDLKSEPAATGDFAWKDARGQVRGILHRGDRILSLEAPDAAHYQALLDRIEGTPQLTIRAVGDKKDVTFGELIDRLLAADLICIGESHDSELNHVVQLQIIKSIYARDERLGVGMEMFQRPFQKEIDRYFQQQIGEEDFLKATEYRQRWGFDWSLYRPIVEFCRKNGVALAALNVPRELTRRLSSVGYAKLNDAEKTQLGTIDFQVKAHRDYWYERLAKMHGEKDVPEERKERSYQVMTAWDEFMADSAARFQKERHLRRLIVLAGSGHIDRGFGIPQRAAKRIGGKALTIHVAVGGDLDKIMKDPPADFVIVVK